jgi:hypothetical protein
MIHQKNSHFIRIVKFLFFFGLLSINGIAQTENEKPIKSGYLKLQLGLSISNHVVPQFFFEYQKDLGKNWQFGISYEQSIGDDHGNSEEYNFTYRTLSFNGYYKSKVLFERVFWTVGAGIGAVNFSYTKYRSGFGETDIKRFEPIFNVSMTLNVKITKSIYLVSSPLIFIPIPPNRVYISPINTDGGYFFSATLLPFGIKIKLR